MVRRRARFALTPKQFDLLFYFVDNAGRVAKKSDLLDAVWTDTYIEETTLARNVSWLRKELESCVGGEQLIETVSKLGYRFTAEVTRPETDLLIVEEQTVQHFRGEEIITFDEPLGERRGEEEKRRNGDGENTLPISLSPLPPVSSSPRPLFSSSPLLLFALALIALGGLAFIIYQNYFKTDAPKAIASNVVALTGLPGNENSPAFSPDGKRLAYSWNGGEGTESDIYVKLIGVGDPLQLTRTKVNDHYPTFSPDGKYIAFVRGKYGEPGEVIIIPSLGGNERRVARLFSGNYSISYSPDGQHIAVIDTEGSTPVGQFAVYLVNIKSGERRRVTAPAEFDGETTPRFSPDGKSLAFIRSTLRINFTGSGEHDLFVVPTTGGQPRQLTFDGVVIHSLAWSADGSYIYFVPYHDPQTFVKRIPATGGEQETVSLSGSHITNIAISPDGGTLAFAEGSQKFSILRVTPDGQPATRLIKSTVNDGDPHFSPDGSRVAFKSDRTGILQIWTADASGENLRQITDAPFPSVSPRFSPDGSLIAFNRKEGKDFANYIISAEGGVPRRTSPKGVQEDHPVWSADGDDIYFISSRAGKPNVWKMSADGDGEAVQITQGGAKLATPAPDGTVYFIKEGFLNEMWRVPTDDGAEEIMPEFSAAGFSGNWIMKETGIYFLAGSSEQGYGLKFYDFADGQINDAPGDYKIPQDFDGSVNITIDGKVLLCTVDEKTSRLTLADLP